MALASVLDQMWRGGAVSGSFRRVIEGDRVRVAASRGGDTDVSFPVEDAGEVGTAIQTRQLASSPTWRAFPRWGCGFQGGAIVAPLLARGQALCAFVVAFDEDHDPSPRDGQLVTAFADHAALSSRPEPAAAGAPARARTAAVARITRLTATATSPIRCCRPWRPSSWRPRGRIGPCSTCATRGTRCSSPWPTPHGVPRRGARAGAAPRHDERAPGGPPGGQGAVCFEAPIQSRPGLHHALRRHPLALDLPMLSRERR